MLEKLVDVVHSYRNRWKLKANVRKAWYHMDIPSEVFDEDSEVHWECKRCVQSPSSTAKSAQYEMRDEGVSSDWLCVHE